MISVKASKSVRLSLVILASVILLGALYWYVGRIQYLKDTARHALVNDLFQEAGWRYREILRLNPLSFEARLGFAHSLQGQGRLREAGPT